MPKSTKFVLPEILEAAYSNTTIPNRIGVNRLEHPSPIKEFPGKILTPMSLSAEDYNEWWILSGDGQPDEDARHWSLWEWETRFHLIKKWDIENAKGEMLDSDIIQKDPAKLPDMRIISWVLAATQPIIGFSTSLPNSPRPLKDISTP